MQGRCSGLRLRLLQQLAAAHDFAMFCELLRAPQLPSPERPPEAGEDWDARVQRSWCGSSAGGSSFGASTWGSDWVDLEDMSSLLDGPLVIDAEMEQPDGSTCRTKLTRTRRLGAGTSGECFLAEDEAGMLVAAKLAFARQDVIQQEARVMQRLNHPHVVRYLGTARHATDFYLLMEYVEGGSLGGYVTSRHPTGVPEDLLRTFGHQLIEAVHFLHGCGIIHGDLKAVSHVLNVLAFSMFLARLGYGMPRSPL